MNPIFLSTAYLAPIQYYSKFLLSDTIYIEQFENYSKQSYRNRCDILAANGRLSLSIPVEKGSSHKKLTRDVRIDHSKAWQHQHWRSIVSAYSSSPFFEFFADDLRPFYKQATKFLLDFNLKIQQVVLEALDLQPVIELTSDFVEPGIAAETDFRFSIHPKAREQKPDARFSPLEYTQVFSEKHGFVPNLSIIDLLFNEGANAEVVLRQCAGIAE